MGWGSGNLGGGAGLNYRIVRGTTQPANPTENLIWVNTTVAGTAYAIQPMEPAGADGLVWLREDLASNAFNALKSNALYAGISGAKVYTGGAWTVVEAYVYQSGAWTQFSSLFGPGSFSYTGTWEEIDEGGGNWLYRFLTSGVLTVSGAGLVDLFAVGAGCGATGTGHYNGGGGGYANTVLAQQISDGQYVVTVGDGGSGVAGGASSFGSLLSASGGVAAVGDKGGAGGSGGGGSGGGMIGNGGAGGSDGADGASSGSTGGAGQGTTTREFGETTGRPYAAGGGGAASTAAYTGGAGGTDWSGTAGAGGIAGGAGGNGRPNTGSGGGGSQSSQAAHSSGGSGIVCMRNARAAA